jgi:hypothetical protein
MSRTYELVSGRRAIAVREAPTAQAALIDYVRSLGCRDEEIVKLGTHSIAWRGAVFKAVPAPGSDPLA